MKVFNEFSIANKVLTMGYGCYHFIPICPILGKDWLMENKKAPQLC